VQITIEERARRIRSLCNKCMSSIMIRTIGFESDRLTSVTDNIDKFMEDMTKQHGSTFRLIDIKYSSTPKLLQDGRQNSDVNYSALIIYEI
jgi:hypothetical protein